MESNNKSHRYLMSRAVFNYARGLGKVLKVDKDERVNIEIGTNQFRGKLIISLSLPRIREGRGAGVNWDR